MNDYHPSVEATEYRLADFFSRLAECRDKRDLTHGIHPYPAKFIPHIPRALISELSAPDGLVVDPMCGSGTTLVEASLLGRRSIGVDLNPIAVLVAKAKTVHLNANDVQEIHALIARVRTGELSARELPSLDELPNFVNRSHWFYDHVAQEISYLLRQIQSIKGDSSRALALCTLSAIIVGVSRQDSETRWVAKDKDVPQGEVLRRFATKLGDAFTRSRDFSRHASARASVVRSDARLIPLEPGTADLIVTSPPYANSHDYYLYNKLRMFWLGYEVSAVQASEIGSRNKHSDQKLDIEHYLINMGAVLREVARILKPTGKAVIVVGDAVIRGDFFDMGHEYANLAASAGLKVQMRYTFAHKKFTSAFTSSFGTREKKHTHVLVMSHE